MRVTPTLRLISICILLCVIAISFLVWKKYHFSSHNFSMPPIPVQTAVVTEKPFIRSLQTIGILSSDQAIVIRPQTAGLIAQFDFTDGQSVEANQTLLVLENSSQKADVDQAKANLNLSQLAYQRSNTLYQEKAVSEQDKDQAFATFKANEALLEKAQSAFDKTMIKSPFAGKLGISKVNVGEYIQIAQEIVNLVRLDPLNVDFKIPEIYLSKVKEGQTIEITNQAFPNKKTQGKIIAIDPQVDSTAHSLSLRAQIPNPELLYRPGLFVTVELILEIKQHVILIPESAVIPKGSKQFVYVVRNQKAFLTEVILGEHQNGNIEIIRGLRLGDVIITAGQNKVQPFSMIQAVK